MVLMFSRVVNIIGMILLVPFILFAMFLLGMVLQAAGLTWLAVIGIAAIVGYVFWQTLVRR